MIKQMTMLSIFPTTTEVDTKGHLVIGGCDTVELAAEFGTPLYLFDELTLRSKCTEFRSEFRQRYADTTVIYACKAFINKAMALVFEEEGLGLDVVSGGELGIAKMAGFPLDRVYFHGNNKSAEELEMALDWNIGRIVVDNYHELVMLNKIAEEKVCKPDILLRLSPGVDPHTHSYISTGNVDSKFGFPLDGGEEAVINAMAMPNLNLVGLHFHLGSLLFEIEPYKQAINFIISFAAEMKQKHEFILLELNVGGGVAIQYTPDSPAPPVSAYAEIITSTIINKCREMKLDLPRLIIEPGRSIVGQAGLALYTVGATKDIPDVRHYVSIDGGMADNVRPALYGSKLIAVVANKMIEKESEEVTIAGKFCESGDILIKDIRLPLMKAGDILAVPGAGAYCLPQSCNYNAFFKPPVIMVKEGKPRIIRRRETLEDLTRCDLI